MLPKDIITKSWLWLKTSSFLPQNTVLNGIKLKEMNSLSISSSNTSIVSSHAWLLALYKFNISSQAYCRQRIRLISKLEIHHNSMKFSILLLQVGCWQTQKWGYIFKDESISISEDTWHITTTTTKKKKKTKNEGRPALYLWIANIQNHMNSKSQIIFKFKGILYFISTDQNRMSSSVYLCNAFLPWLPTTSKSMFIFSATWHMASFGSPTSVIVSTTTWDKRVFNVVLC